MNSGRVNLPVHLYFCDFKKQAHTPALKVWPYITYLFVNLMSVSNSIHNLFIYIHKFTDLNQLYINCAIYLCVSDDRGNYDLYIGKNGRSQQDISTTWLITYMRWDNDCVTWKTSTYILYVMNKFEKMNTQSWQKVWSNWGMFIKINSEKCLTPPPLAKALWGRGEVGWTKVKCQTLSLIP